MLWMKIRVYFIVDILETMCNSGGHCSKYKQLYLDTSRNTIIVSVLILTK